MSAHHLAIAAHDVRKTFRGGWRGRRATSALAGVSLEVSRGIIFGLLGPNGAGKTTLLSIFATLLVPDGGRVSILGHDVVREAATVRRRLNMASGNASFLWSLRPPEVIAFYGRLYGLGGAALSRRVAELMETFELGRHARAPYNELSTGIKQRLALAKSLVNDPDLLFLDEPTLGLDPDVSVRIRGHVADLRRRGMTIVLTTHYMREAEELCDEIAFIKGGRVLARGTAEELKRAIHLGDVIAFRLEPPATPALAGAPGVLRCTARGDWVECAVDVADKRLPELLRVLHAEGAVIRDIQVREPDLEEVFVELAR
jgi:ABC-2 type transport system ATP-binding protein